MNKEQERAYRVWRLLLGGFIESGTKIEIVGEENIPDVGAYILIANHRSNTDPLILSLKIERPINWMAAKYLYNIPVLGDFFKGIGTISIEKDKLEKTFSKAREVLRKKQLLGIFPEGWNVIGNGCKRELGKFHTGFARIALKNNVPVIPIAIIGLKERKEAFAIPPFIRKIWKFPTPMEKFTHMLIFKEVLIKIGKPKKLKVKKMTQDNLEKISEEMREEIGSLLDSLKK